MNNSNQIRRIRAIATIVIVLYHCFCPLMNYGWNMYQSPFWDKIGHLIFNIILADKMLPTFFIISGILYYYLNKNGKSLNLWKKFDRLIIPYALFESLYFVQIIPLFGESRASGHLWFLPTLFICFVLVKVFYKVNKHILLLISFLLIFIAEKLSLSLPLSLYTIHSVCQYLFYFILGCVLPSITAYLRNKKWLLVLILILYGTCVLITDFPFRGTLLIISFNILLFSLVSNRDFDNTKLSHIILEIDRYSFPIYLIHHFYIVIMVSTPFFTNLYISYTIYGILLMVVTSILFSYISSILLKRIGFKWI